MNIENKTIIFQMVDGKIKTFNFVNYFNQNGEGNYIIRCNDNDQDIVLLNDEVLSYMIQ